MKSKKVLIVDYNELNRKLFENLIGHLYSYESARDGHEAIELATKTAFDLILMDIQMPKMDGISAMKQIRGHAFGTCPILAVTAYADETERISFLEQGFDEFITKPIKPKEFLLMVQSFFYKNPKFEVKSLSESPPSSLLNPSTLDQLLKYNSKEFIRKIYVDFLAECDELLECIAKADKDKIPPILMEKIHTLKGNSGTLGAEAIYQAAVICETFGRQKKVSEFVNKLENIVDEVKKFKKFFIQDHYFEL